VGSGHRLRQHASARQAGRVLHAEQAAPRGWRRSPRRPARDSGKNLRPDSAFRAKDELLEDEFQKFILDQPPEALSSHADASVAIKYCFKAYASDKRLREIIQQGRFTDLIVHPVFGMTDFKAVPKEWRAKILSYVKDYVSLNLFM